MRKKKEEKKIEPKKEKINDIIENDKYIYDPSDPYGEKLRR